MLNWQWPWVFVALPVPLLVRYLIPRLDAVPAAVRVPFFHDLLQLQLAGQKRRPRT